MYPSAFAFRETILHYRPRVAQTHRLNSVVYYIFALEMRFFDVYTVLFARIA